MLTHRIVSWIAEKVGSYLNYKMNNRRQIGFIVTQNKNYDIDFTYQIQFEKVFGRLL
jgi:protein involved in ribonucleotide reduction